MNSSIAKILSTSLLCMVGISLTHAADEGSSKAEVKKQIQVCSKKQQGEWITYANKGVTFNGTCETNAEGKLQFAFPAPPAGTATTSADTSASPANVPNLEQQPAATEAQATDAEIQPQANPETSEINPASTDNLQAIPSEATHEAPIQ